MKKIALSISFVVLSAISALAQRYCFIDSKQILDKLPDYKTAQAQIDKTSKAWQDEVNLKMQEVEKMYKSYQAERAMLSDEVRRKREDEIMNLEKAAKDLQTKRFGYEGDLFKLRQELVKPVQDKVFSTVQKYAVSKGFDMVLDKSGGITLFYADPKLDKTDDILKQLGATK